jgi:hypothetical protein
MDRELINAIKSSACLIAGSIFFGGAEIGSVILSTHQGQGKTLIISATIGIMFHRGVGLFCFYGGYLFSKSK